MSKRPNASGASKIAPTVEKNKRTPQRMCVACRTMKPKEELIRVINRDGFAALDTSGRSAGRGAYICKNADCAKKAFKIKALERHIGAKISPEFETELKTQMSGAEN